MSNKESPLFAKDILAFELKELGFDGLICKRKSHNREEVICKCDIENICHCLETGKYDDGECNGLSCPLWSQNPAECQAFSYTEENKLLSSLPSFDLEEAA